MQHLEDCFHCWHCAWGSRETTYCHAAMVYRWTSSINSIHGFWTKSLTQILNMRAWLLAKDRITCPTYVCEVSSKFRSCLIVVLTSNITVHVSICSDWICGGYSPDIHRWHITNGNERQIIDGYNQPDIHFPHHDGHPPLSVGLQNRRDQGLATVWSRRSSTT